MQRERKEVRGILSLGTLFRVSAISGFAIGVMFGVFAGVVSYLVNRNFLDLMLIIEQSGNWSRWPLQVPV